MPGQGAKLLVRLALEGLGKRFGRRRGFANLAVEGNHSEGLGVTGPNGAGKSPWRLVIAGLLRPTRGRVVASLDGKPLAFEDRREWLGMVAPDLTLYAELTALENLHFFETIRGR